MRSSTRKNLKVEEKNDIIEEIEVKENFNIKVLAVSLRKRKEPSTESEVIGFANVGEIYECIEEIQDWYKIKDGFWVMAKYCEKV